MELLSNGSHDKREGCWENGSNLKHTFDVENQRDDMGQLSPVSEIWCRADRNAGIWDVVVFSTEYEAPMATCTI